jgi:hypothetical protein
MTTRQLRPWSQVVHLHPDVDAGNLTEAVFAIDLGALAAGDPNVPAVYRDPESFFRATYLTADMRTLLEQVLASLAGQQGYNRVLKLRTPFGGGKSHTLATLLHAARSQGALKVLPEAKTLPDPGSVDVAVFDGEKFDSRDGVTLSSGKHIRTMWGWLACQLGEEYYQVVQGHDQDRISPGGDVIKKLLTGKPKLFLLDEVLKYMERASAVRVEESTLQRQAMDFLHNLTVEVANSTSAAMVYSLQWSAREALGNVALLEQLDHLAARVDQLHEPVSLSGDDILHVLHRRLLARLPDEDVASAVAVAYQDIVTGMRRAHAVSAAERQQAEDEGLELQERLRKAYPFHPALIDIMRERWSSLDFFQRTRGALRFLASCLYSVKRANTAKPLLGPGDVPLDDPEVRVKFVKELGLRDEYDGALTADLCGPNARAKRIDERLARENPGLVGTRPATRLATAIFMYSFGGLRRGTGDGEALPPGVTEAELLASVISPELDNITATAALSELRNHCLYLHYDGVRYVFKKDPNVTKLIEDEEQQVARKPTEIRQKIKELLTQRLQVHREAIVWTEHSVDLPDEDPSFLIGYLPLEFVSENRQTQERRAKELLEKYGERPRRYRNGVGLAIPHKDQIEPLRRAVRYLMAIERIDTKKAQLRLNRDQLQQLNERKRTEEGAAESAFRQLYSAVWLPRAENGAIGLELIEAGGRPLQSTGVHERVMELLTNTTKKVFSGTTPRKIVELMRLGEAEQEQLPRMGIKTREVRDAFFSFLGFTRLDTSDALRKAIARGVQEGIFGYTSGIVPVLSDDGKYQVSRDKIAFGRIIPDDEIDLDSGFLMMPTTFLPAPEPTGAGIGGEIGEGGGQYGGEIVETGGATEDKGAGISRPQVRKDVTLTINGSRDQLYKAWPAIANLADKAGKASIQVSATSEEGFDPSWLRNAVYEPLEEADVLGEQEP